MRKLRVALVSGFWGQNIGNAFFNIGGQWLLRNVFEGADIEFILDAPAYRTFNDKSKGNPKNDWNLLKRLNIDFLVLQGPLFTADFPVIWRETFKELKKNGSKILIVSAGLFRYTDEEISINREFLLKEVRPALLSTRDFETYEAFKDCSEFSYAGIDSAFYAPEAYKPFELKTAPFITVNYDRFPEPNIQSSISKPFSKGDTDFEILGKHWQLKYPKILELMSSRGKVESYISSMLDFRRMPETIDGYEIVRPEHRFNPHITWKIYKNPNDMASDEPWTYFTLYSNTSLTISDRVHACVATLAFGKPAILYKHTKRAYLFDRVGLGDIGNRALSLDPIYLKQEKDKQMNFFRTAWSNIISK
jgi:hypothetical protein